MKRELSRPLAALLAAALACAALLGSLACSRGPDVVVGSKDFTEQLILGEMFAQLLEATTQLEVERKLNLAGTQVAFGALQAGSIDVYPEYSGTVLVSILKRAPIADEAAALHAIEQPLLDGGVVAAAPLGFSNTYAVVVRKGDANLANVATISDLVPHTPALMFGSTHEFFDRPDGFPNLREAYDLKFKDSSGVDAGLMYSAVKNRSLDVIAAFSTDGRIRQFDLRVLSDDKKFFPAYQAIPLVRKDTLAKHPEVGVALGRLAGRITAEEMTAMNYAVDFGGKSPSHVATEFLISKGWIDASRHRDSVSANEMFFRFAWSERRALLKYIEQHLAYSLMGLLCALLVAVPVGISLTRFPRLAGPTFSVVNTVQTIPSLALLGFMVPLVGIGTVPVIIALFLYGLLPLLRNTYTGIREVDPDLKEAARGIGLTERQILWNVELPLALPTMLAGVRISAVLIVGTATLGALVGAEGLGAPIFRGLASVNQNNILLGAIPAAILAIVIDKVLHRIELRLVSRGLSASEGKD